MILDVQAEFLAAHAAGAQVVDVLHHQFPTGRLGTAGGALEQFDEKGFRIVAQVGRKFTYLIGCAAVGIFIGDSQDVIRL